MGLMNEYLSNDNRVKPNVLFKNITISFTSYRAKLILLAYKEEEENSNLRKEIFEKKRTHIIQLRWQKNEEPT